MPVDRAHGKLLAHGKHLAHDKFLAHGKLLHTAKFKKKVDSALLIFLLYIYSVLYSLLNFVYLSFFLLYLVI